GFNRSSKLICLFIICDRVIVKSSKHTSSFVWEPGWIWQMTIWRGIQICFVNPAGNSCETLEVDRAQRPAGETHFLCLQEEVSHHGVQGCPCHAFHRGFL